MVRAVAAEVVGVRDLTPAMVRITVAGADLRTFTAEGGDQWLRLFLPRDGQSEPLLPQTDDWWPEVCRLPEDVRPIVRNYSVRAARPAAGQLDIDVVRHGQGGPGSRWAGTVKAGDRVGLLDQSTTYAPPPGTPWQLLLADESALPALASIVAGAPAGTRLLAYVEVPSAADVQELGTAAAPTVHWLPRAPGDVVGGRLLAALAAADLPDGTPYVWLAGEQRLVRQARRHLVGDRGYPRDAVCFMTYWRRGRRADDPD